VTILGRGGRKPGEPIYLRRHIIALALAVGLPVVLLQLYKIYIGPVSFDAQIGFGLLISILAGIILTRAYRSSAQNEP
jgi:multisubunit Na+/H+ antiporter MnhF subunit